MSKDKSLKQHKHDAAQSRGPKSRGLEHWHLVSVFLILFDLAAIAGAYFLALWLRFDCRFNDIPDMYFVPWLNFAPICAVVGIVVFWRMHLYQSIWRFASFVELERIFVGSMALSVFHSICITVFFRRMPSTYYIFGAAIQFMLVLSVRFA